jgi:RNA-directed DNA polymerase
VRFSDDFVILSKEWINQGRVEAVLAILGLELNKEKTYVGTIENGFEFVGFYFQGYADENGIKRGIKVIPTEGSVEKIIESIENIENVEKSNSDDENENQSLDKAIKNIYKVVDPWVTIINIRTMLPGLKKLSSVLIKKSKDLFKYIPSKFLCKKAVK